MERVRKRMESMRRKGVSDGFFFCLVVVVLVLRAGQGVRCAGI